MRWCCCHVVQMMTKCRSAKPLRSHRPHGHALVDPFVCLRAPTPHGTRHNTSPRVTVTVLWALSDTAVGVIERSVDRQAWHTTTDTRWMIARLHGWMLPPSVTVAPQLALGTAQMVQKEALAAFREQKHTTGLLQSPLASSAATHVLAAIT